MRPKRKPEPVSTPDTPSLTFRGLDLCDGCGATLEPGDRLSGLCPACLGAPEKASPEKAQ